MQPRRRALAVSLVAIFTMVSVGCSTEGQKAGTDTTATSNDGTTTVVEPGPNDEADPYIDALKRSWQASNLEGDDLPMTDDQIDCMAPHIVGILGVERMKANGVTPADLESDEPLDFSGQDVTEEEAQAVYDTFGTCGMDLRDLMLADMADDEGSDAAYLACMEDALSEENVRLLIVTTMVKGTDALETDAEVAPVMAHVIGCNVASMDEDG